MQHVNTRDFLRDKLHYTVGVTKKKLMQLSDSYDEKIFVKQRTENFDPHNCSNTFMIDGLGKAGSYVNNAFLKLTTKTTVTLKLNNDATTIITFYHKNDVDLIKKCIKRIYCMINVFGNKDNVKIYDGMTIDILLYYAPRIMTDRYKHDISEINEVGKKCYFNCTCGYASIDNDKFKLCVTRKNGCLGLLVHELGHICELDLGRYYNDKYNFPDNRLTGWKYLVKKYFDIDKSCHIGNMTEGLNNGNSSIIHSMFIALESKHNSGDLFNIYKQCYEKEFIYAIEMLGKLLKWFDYKSLNELFRRNKGKYTQRSLLLEYILLRCVYLIHFDTLGMFKKNDEKLEANDGKYTLQFFQEMVSSANMIDKLLSHIHNKGTIRMEYYYFA